MNDQFTLLFALQARAMSAQEIAEFLGITRTPAQKRLARLRTSDKMLVRVMEWRRQPDGGTGEMTPIYGLADGIADAPKPPRIPIQERRAKYVAKYPERAAEIRRNSRRKYFRNVAAHRHIQASALWGQLLDPMRG